MIDPGALATHGPHVRVDQRTCGEPHTGGAVLLDSASGTEYPDPAERDVADGVEYGRHCEPGDRAVADGHIVEASVSDPGAGAGDRKSVEVHRDTVGADDQCIAAAGEVGLQREVGGKHAAAPHRGGEGGCDRQ